MGATYSSRSNAIRAGRRQFGDGNFEVHEADGRFVVTAVQGQPAEVDSKVGPSASEPGFTGYDLRSAALQPASLQRLVEVLAEGWITAKDAGQRLGWQAHYADARIMPM